ncbi:MCE family protein [Actinophytocola oryzae]|uniref:Phospholipid/cholesterol/gamma-HCH transport system substrate-binding protein n=1 Tax=Actinophytocola oryzae TaxID=502181 RepID=A0A4R7VZ33_9PSEU|nr:MlaD family protein [Actinophytocola oryzae]TDV55354.1 phospholipid/cholesterol/gamma-HCH transport system substrate-binding protein [Actinophytocola oryzae]
MLTRMIRGQLVAFVIVTVVGVTYAAVHYLRLPRLLGVGTYAVTLDLPRAGALYENALVTLRGIQVGRVDRLDLDRAGVRVVLGIDDGVSIPADSAVAIRSTSAIGEQYVDFQPRSASAPLRDGQVLPASQVSFPTPVGDLLFSVHQLAATLPLDDLHSTVDEVYRAFRGTGEDLAAFLRAATRLQDLANANLDPTLRLLQDLVPVLATQQRLGPDIRAATGDLAAVTGTLRSVEPSIRGAIEGTRPMVDEFDALLTQVSPTLPQLLTDLISTGQVLNVYLPNIRHSIVVFPAAVASLTGSTAWGIQDSGQNPPLYSALGFKLTFNNPPPCVTGYDPDRVPPSDLSNSRPPPRDAYCKEPKDSPIAVRGFRNAPCPPGSPTGPGSTGATAAACGWQFQPVAEADAAYDAGIRHMLEVAARNPKTRAENEAFIGDARFPGPRPTAPPPAINGAGNTSHQGPNGLFSTDGKTFLNGAGLPLPEVSTANGPVSGLEQFLLAPMLAPTGS